MSVTTCPSCHTPAPPGAIFCDHCGYDLRTVAPTAQQPLPPTVVISHAEASEIICPSCQHANIPGSAFCENCGAPLAQAQQPAQPAPQPPPVQAPAGPVNPPGAETLIQQPVLEPTPPSSVVGRLVIQASNVSLAIPPGKQTIVIGREDPVSGVFPDIDLDPHGGHEAGVGRRHAQLILQGAQLYIEDLDSVNGTVVNKQKLAPRQPHLLNHGDELRFGKMVLMYYSS